MDGYDVVWHGGMANDPLGGLSKGCLLEPRDQPVSMRQPLGLGYDDLGITRDELNAAVDRLNASLRRPVKFGRCFGEVRNIPFGRRS